MRHGRPAAIWPFLLVLAALFVLVVTMPREWDRVANRQRHGRPVPKAWEDLALLPRSSTDESEKVVRPLIRQFQITPAAARDESLPDVPWMPAETADRLAARAETGTGRKLEIILPGLPPLDEINESSDPSIAPLASNTSDESRSADASNRTTRIESRQPETIARRSTTRQDSVPDTRNHPPADFSPAVMEKNQKENVSPIWAPPESLYARLNELAEDKRTADWANRARRRVQRLGEMVDARIDPKPKDFADLWATVNQAEPLASSLGNPGLASRLRRAGYAIHRRLDTWQRVLAPQAELDEAFGTDEDLSRVRLALSGVDEIISGTPHGRAWREYLLLDALQEASRNKQTDDVEGRTALARRILGRVAMVSLSESQERFLASKPMDRLAVELRRMAAGRPDRARLLGKLEQYEQTGRASDARRLADECLWLGFRENPKLKDLKRHVTMHYRNANLRMELSEAFLNRLMPKRLPEYDRVSDTVLGKAVRGQSLTATDVAIRMIPDPHRIRLALEISGEVAALTSSKSGPAVFQNTSESRYTARKPMELSVDGLALFPAEVDDVNNVTRLYKLRTKFDDVPLLGEVIKNAARTQINMRRSEMRREVEQKVASRGRRRIDEESNARLGDVSDRLKKRVLQPMHGMALGPRMIEAKTTEDRLTMRLRIASPRQLGAHTPRPKTPADSLASFQVHQTAMNNMAEQLALGGKTFTLPELRAHLAKKLNWPELAEKKTKNDNVIITFAEQDAVRVTCKDGRITIDLSIVWLERGRRVWSDFLVRVQYRPRVEGLSAKLVRDRVIRLPDGHIPPSAQPQLRGIFSVVFPKYQSRQLVPDRIRNDPKMADLAVTQMDIEDGWIALAFGPKPSVARAQGSKKR